MAETKKVKDAARAIDATDLIARARRQSLVRSLWMLVGWALLIGVVVLIWSCLSAVFSLSEEAHDPRLDQPAGQVEPAPQP